MSALIVTPKIDKTVCALAGANVYIRKSYDEQKHDFRFCILPSPFEGDDPSLVDKMYNVEIKHIEDNYFEVVFYDGVEDNDGTSFMGRIQDVNMILCAKYKARSK